METHFIEHFKDDLFDDSCREKEAYEEAIYGAALVAACICNKEHSNFREGFPGGSNVLCDCMVFHSLFVIPYMM